MKSPPITFPLSADMIRYFLLIIIAGTVAVPVFAQSPLDRRFRDAAQRVFPSLITIESRVMKTIDGSTGGKQRSVEETGIGFAITCNGKACVITNNHVVAEADPKSIRLTLHDRRFLNVERIIGNEEFDIAVLDVESAARQYLIPAPLGESDQVEIADFVLALGSPFGLKESVSFGIISAKNRRSIPSGNHQMPLQSFFQTDASINPGNSGGPLVSADGKVIGIITAIASGGGTSEGVAFAIPMKNALRIAAQLAQNGVVTRPYLGVELDPGFGLEAHVAAGIDRLIGAKIQSVQPNSPAAAAGLRIGDILLKFDGTEIEDNLHLIQLIALAEEGESPEMVVQRDRTLFQARPRLTLQISR